MKRVSILLLSLCLMASCMVANAQTGSDYDQQLANLKNVIPPSPNAASLGKYADWPVNLYTGVPNISIPIYTLQGRRISVPISLSYHASGIKVGEVASWAGLGWSLNAGGVITRSIRGLPDEDVSNGFFVTRNHYTNPDNFSFAGSPPHIWKNDVVGASKGLTDFEQDIYMLNAMGHSYKFLFQSDGKILTIPHSDLKISVNFTTKIWDILLEDGTRLVFGGDGYTEISTGDANLDVSPFGSSWYLKSITSHTGEVVTFNYTSSLIENDDNIAESDFMKIFLSGDSNANCDIIRDSDFTKTTAKHRNIAVLQLSSINSELGKVEFITDTAERLDLSGGYALKGIKVTSWADANPVVEYKLSYTYTDAVSSVEFNPQAKTEFSKRLKLMSMEQIAGALSIQKWTFEYNAQNLPSRRSFAQDYWGYFNGAVDNNTLLPPVYYALPTNLGISITDRGFIPPMHDIGANKEANGMYMQAEILTKINYPTGGYSTFNFEPNTSPVAEEQFSKLTNSLAVATNVTPFVNIKTTTFTITQAQHVYTDFSGMFSEGFIQRNSGFGIPRPVSRTLDISGQSMASIVIKDPQGNVIWSTGITSVSQLVGGQFSEKNYVNLPSAGVYTLKLQTISEYVDPNDISVNASITYNVTDDILTINKAAGGLRVANITDYDAPNSKKTERFFKYELPLVISPISKQDFVEESNEIVGDPFGSQLPCTYNRVTRNSSTKYALGSIQGGTIGYGKVTTTSDATGTKGKTETVFSNDPDINIELSKTFPYPQPTSNDNRRGLMLMQTDYEASGFPVKQVENTYDFLPIKTISGLKAGSNVVYSSGYCNDEYGFCGIVYSIYGLTTEQIKKTTTIQRVYDNLGLNPVETTEYFFYENPNYTHLTKTSTTDSRTNPNKVTILVGGQPVQVYDRMIETSYKYPTEFTDAVSNGMITNNIISPVLEKKTKLITSGNQNGTDLSFEKTTYNAQFLPAKVETRLGTSTNLVTEIELLEYDASGNLTRYKERNGITTQLVYFGAGDLGKVNLMRSKTIGYGSSLALTTTYDYYPLIGLKSTTAPNGISSYYTYDVFGRLEFIKDTNQKLVKSYKYNYRSQ